MDTKACNLTKEEIENLIQHIGNKLCWPNANFNDLMERLNYLYKRLKAFDESEVKPVQTAQAANSAWPSN